MESLQGSSVGLMASPLTTRETGSPLMHSHAVALSVKVHRSSEAADREGGGERGRERGGDSSLKGEEKEQKKAFEYGWSSGELHLNPACDVFIEGRFPDFLLLFSHHQKFNRECLYSGCWNL